MANIKIELGHPVIEGMPLSFRAPCNCTEVNGIKVTYPDGENTAFIVFSFADAHGNNLAGLGNLFTANAMVRVILDPSKAKAYIQNADTNKYLEGRFETIQKAASNAQSTANGAVTAAANAQNTANSAATAASNAQNTANGAVTAAANAQSTANGAATAAANAQSTANGAATAAANAQNTANSKAPTPIISQTDIIAGSPASDGRPYHVIE